MRLLVSIVLAVVAEVLLVVAFWSDPDNYDCGSDCGAQSLVVGGAAFVIVPLVIIVLIAASLVRLHRGRN